ncbi:hypothetical protein AVEN_30882-1, partial [Araneus ventricosus]
MFTTRLIHGDPNGRSVFRPEPPAPKANPTCQAAADAQRDTTTGAFIKTLD